MSWVGSIPADLALSDGVHSGVVGGCGLGPPEVAHPPHVILSLIWCGGGWRARQGNGCRATFKLKSCYVVAGGLARVMSYRPIKKMIFNVILGPTEVAGVMAHHPNYIYIFYFFSYKTHFRICLL